MFVFVFKTTSVNAATGAAVAYINTVYSLHLCETGSTHSNCKNPLTLRSTDGTSMDIGGVTAGASAGSYGNLNVLPKGTIYTFGQVVLSRSFSVSGTGKDANGDDCSTGSGAAGTATAFAVGTEGTAYTLQTLYAGNSTGNGVQMNSSPNKNSDETGDAADGVLAAGDLYMKFRWQLAKPYTYDGAKVPTMKIAFDLSSGINFNGDCGGSAGTTNGLTPGKPVITNLIE